MSDLRHEIGDYLRRHALAGSDLAGADVAVSELLSNVVLHAPGPAWAHLDWDGERPLLAVHDLGAGFEPAATLPDDLLSASGGRGLFIVSNVAGWMTVAAKRAGGSKVTVALPVTRTADPDLTPPERRVSSLPAPQEARADGTFGRESFLRALVVQLAEAVERNEGPDAAAAAVAQVGADVGGRMEDEYRRVEGIVGDLRPAQIADLYVRLKAAIDGDFYVIEADDERIVLGSRACPFGDVVRRAPGLCRMTSSVFGGIAARNTGGSSVVLEERIALGDPECRVVVWLRGARRGEWGAAHEYAAAPAPPALD
ncbi:methanogen output domain 1-containing protein [Conexibacter sp. JD483]|uniref:methanogen output domain 1-containing protein n=1 Tax=unclassified Conexibacter TaxID=2627773 RepID=UPI0027230EDB|nr:MULTISPECIES: methanogen output domain 1-containing protein [unclassified Conexibacter]MDO8188950.1 methanogen output domain 1-containing protein [Conexibacter sp. CPCC 205706]MDO8201735.1 methanogen output domain 1-containing protein [Conexibacter sp. CPCC 205762]MDR9371418.1 methanogen output domain 1-containing protein [Conexibacter sp. JD483]